MAWHTLGNVQRYQCHIFCTGLFLSDELSEVFLSFRDVLGCLQSGNVLLQLLLTFWVVVESIIPDICWNPQLHEFHLQTSQTKWTCPTHSFMKQKIKSQSVLKPLEFLETCLAAFPAKCLAEPCCLSYRLWDTSSGASLLAALSPSMFSDYNNHNCHVSICGTLSDILFKCSSTGKCVNYCNELLSLLTL